jgi:hypothetical protein
MAKYPKENFGEVYKRFYAYLGFRNRGVFRLDGHHAAAAAQIRWADIALAQENVAAASERARRRRRHQRGRG